jgi:sortase A
MPRKKLLKNKVKNKKKKNFWRGINLILIGILLILFSFLWRLHNERILSFNTSELSKLESGTKKGFRPIQISISSVGINLKIKEAFISNGSWQVWKDSANHLVSSANPGGGGNIVIYGHNKNSVFGPIRWVEAGQTIELIGENNKKYLYKVQKIIETTPNDIQYVLPKNTETLTLYTCSGIFDSKRYLVIAYPQ